MDLFYHRSDMQPRKFTSKCVLHQRGNILSDFTGWNNNSLSFAAVKRKPPTNSVGWSTAWPWSVLPWRQRRVIYSLRLWIILRYHALCGEGESTKQSTPGRLSSDCSELLSRCDELFTVSRVRLFKADRQSLQTTFARPTLIQPLIQKTQGLT